MPRPRAGDWLRDEISAWRYEGLAVIVSLLESHEERELDLKDEAAFCYAEGIEYLSFPVPDRGVPASFSGTRRLVDFLVEKLIGGLGVGIHCRAGIGRSSLIAACVLVKLGVTPSECFTTIARSRGLPVPDTSEQQRWLSLFSRDYIAPKLVK